MGFMVAEAVTPAFGALGVGGLVAFCVGSAMLMRLMCEEHGGTFVGLSGTSSSGRALDARRLLDADNRQYLTGLRLGGRNTLVLIDSSASMLDSSLVSIIRRRNMPLERKINGRKWQRSIKTAEWILTNLPETANFQVYHFNETAAPLVEGTDGQWFDSNDQKQVARFTAALRKVDPGKGTSLINAFRVASTLNPMPDNIVLITDGLPTMGVSRSNRHTISARNRLRLYRQSLEQLPMGIPINTILLPIEGDPVAAPQFWRLAMYTRGSFMSPPTDWP